MTIETKHTKRPWFLKHGRAKHSDAVFIKSADGVFVAKVYGHDGQPVDANARLIAAAPELLEACLAIVNDPRQYDAEVDETERTISEDQYNALCAAIRKATGEAK